MHGSVPKWRVLIFFKVKPMYIFIKEKCGKGSCHAPTLFRMAHAHSTNMALRDTARYIAVSCRLKKKNVLNRARCYSLVHINSLGFSVSTHVSLVSWRSDRSVTPLLH